MDAGINMKSPLKLLLASVFLASISACGLFEDDGACEYRYDFSSGKVFACSNEKSDTFNPASDSCTYGDARAFHEGRSCDSLGYSLSSGSGSYYYNNAKSQSPFGSSSLGNTGGTGGGGGNTLNCNSVWTGSPSDVQVSTQCQTACSYHNIGNTQGKNAACSIVSNWGATASCRACP